MMKNLVDRIKDIGKVASLSALLSISAPFVNESFVYCNPFKEFNSKPISERINDGRVVQIYRWQDFPNKRRSEHAEKINPEGMFNVHFEGDYSLVNYTFERNRGRDDNIEFFKKLRFFVDKYSRKEFGKTASQLTQKEAAEVSSYIVADFKTYGYFIAYHPNDQEYFELIEDSVTFPDYYGGTINGKQLKKELKRNHERAWKYLGNLVNEFDYGPLEVLFTRKYGVCRHYSRLTNALYNFIKTLNPSLKNSYLLHFISMPMNHSFNMMIELTDSDVNISFIDPTFYDSTTVLNAVDEEHFVTKDNRANIISFVNGGKEFYANANGKYMFSSINRKLSTNPITPEYDIIQVLEKLSSMENILERTRR